MRRTKKPGTIEKNMKDSASLKKGIFKIIDRSVNVRKIITVNIQFLMLKSFIMLFIFKFKPSKTSKTSYYCFQILLNQNKININLRF